MRGCISTGDSLRCEPSARPEPSAWCSVLQFSLRHSSDCTRSSAAVQKATARGTFTTPITGNPSLSIAWAYDSVHTDASRLRPSIVSALCYILSYADPATYAVWGAL